MISLTSDFGTRDFYLAALKASIFKIKSDAKVLDISHQIEAYNVIEAAYNVKSASSFFPDHTLHMILVDSYHERNAELVLMVWNNQYFLAPDNGVLTLVANIQESNVKLFKLKEKLTFTSSISKFTYYLKEFLESKENLTEKFEQVSEIFTQYWGRPVQKDDLIRGSIVHIDKYGNVITNITRVDFEEIRNNRDYEIFIRNVRLKDIRNSYADVSNGEAIARFTDSGYLEIAIRRGSAESLLGLKNEDLLTIEFKDE